MMGSTSCMLWLCPIMAIGHGEEHVLDRKCVLVALCRTQEILIIGNRAVEHGLRVRGGHDVVVLARPDRLIHRQDVHVCEDLGERGHLVAQEREVLAIITRNHVHGVDAVGHKAALHRPDGLHRGERADRLPAEKGVIHDRVEAGMRRGRALRPRCNARLAGTDARFPPGRSRRASPRQVLPPR